MEYKYIAKFESKAFFSKKPAPESFESKASMGLDELRSLLPDSQEISSNPDLLYTCFNAAVANLVNLNGDGITTEGAKNLVASCKNKPTNIEHDRNSVIGVVTNYGFSSFGDNKILTIDELTDVPFNISLAAIVWKLCNRGFSEFIAESQDEDSFYYKAVSTSWEVGFNSYTLAVGSKDLRSAEIISDSEKIEEYSKYLLMEGGTGFLPDGREVYRIIGDDCRFLGCAFTTNPAAAVQGVLCTDYSEVEEEVEEEDEEEEEEEEKPEGMDDEDDGKCKDKMSKSSIIEENEENLNKNLENLVINKKTRVIKRMKYNTVDELVDNLQEAHASDVRDFIVSQVEKANQEYIKLQSEKANKEKELADAIASAESFKTDAAALKDEVAQLRASIKAQEDSIKFSERMDSLKEQYDLDQAACKSIASRINGLSDEEFAQWLVEMKPFLKEKTAENTSLASSKQVTPEIPNASSDNVKVDEIKELFKQIKISL